MTMSSPPANSMVEPFENHICIVYLSQLKTQKVICVAGRHNIHWWFKCLTKKNIPSPSMKWWSYLFYSESIA